jgi:hypothetical protein
MHSAACRMILTGLKKESGRRSIENIKNNSCRRMPDSLEQLDLVNFDAHLARLGHLTRKRSRR